MHHWTNAASSGRLSRKIDNRSGEKPLVSTYREEILDTKLTVSEIAREAKFAVSIAINSGRIEVAPSDSKQIDSRSVER